MCCKALHSKSACSRQFKNNSTHESEDSSMNVSEWIQEETLKQEAMIEEVAMRAMLMSLAADRRLIEGAALATDIECRASLDHWRRDFEKCRIKPRRTSPDSAIAQNPGAIEVFLSFTVNRYV